MFVFLRPLSLLSEANSRTKRRQNETVGSRKEKTMKWSRLFWAAAGRWNTSSMER
jgi:hypothetical protein